jgi:hypothetical protein
VVGVVGGRRGEDEEELAVERSVLVLVLMIVGGGGSMGLGGAESDTREGASAITTSIFVLFDKKGQVELTQEYQFCVELA